MSTIVIPAPPSRLISYFFGDAIGKAEEGLGVATFSALGVGGGADISTPRESRINESLIFIGTVADNTCKADNLSLTLITSAFPIILPFLIILYLVLSRIPSWVPLSMANLSPLIFNILIVLFCEYISKGIVMKSK